MHRPLKLTPFNRPVTLSLLLVLTGLLSSCFSPPIKPEGKNIKVSRMDPGPDCRPLGAVEGRSLKTKSTFEEALEDLKTDAARKGATDVKIESSSGLGTAVRGEAFFCP